VAAQPGRQRGSHEPHASWVPGLRVGATISEALIFNRPSEAEDMNNCSKTIG
jgi:hypothetical protein